MHYSDTKHAYTFNYKEAARLGMQGFSYLRLHIESHTSSQGLVYCANRTIFNIILSMWNRVGGFMWKYWEA